jgi:hypothetical protein
MVLADFYSRICRYRPMPLRIDDIQNDFSIYQLDPVTNPDLHEQRPSPCCAISWSVVPSGPGSGEFVERCARKDEQ